MKLTEQDKDFSIRLALDAQHELHKLGGIKNGRFVLWNTQSIDRPRSIRNFDYFGQVLLAAYKRGEEAARAVARLEQPVDTPDGDTHIEIRACKETGNLQSGKISVVWCKEDEAHYFSVYRGCPGAFRWVADFDKKDDALEYAFTIGRGLTITNRIGEV